MKIQYLLLIVMLVTSSCGNAWLEVKPKKSLEVPKTVDAYQAILDNSRMHNTDYPGVSEIASGDYYVTDEIFDRLISTEQIAYLWKNDPSYQSNRLTDWYTAYSRILRLNIVLEGIQAIRTTTDNQKEWNNVKGSALFLRAFNNYLLAQVFAPPYNPQTASSEPGIPLRLSADVNEHVGRSTLKQTFDQIIEDLLEAKEMLPLISEYKTRPTKAAVFALLSRVYLINQDYSKALLMADSCLSNFDYLMDFNDDVDIDITQINPIKRFNGETIFHSRAINYSSFSPSRLTVDPKLYLMYKPGDLRKDVFFQVDGEAIRYKGSYDGTRLLFSGLATDEVYLTRAECYVRTGETELALSDLNFLLSHRMDAAYFNPITSINNKELLDLILAERRKELCFRTIRWSDLRRLNFDPETQTTLTRIVKGKHYKLLPGDVGYTFAIPNQEILLNNMDQNQ